MLKLITAIAAITLSAQYAQALTPTEFDNCAAEMTSYGPLISFDQIRRYAVAHPDCKTKVPFVTTTTQLSPAGCAIREAEYYRHVLSLENNDFAQAARAAALKAIKIKCGD